MAYEMASGEGAVLLGGSADQVSARDESDGYSYLPWVDLICAGVPCQDVSVAGKRAGLKGERTGLFYDFARILQELRPSWFVFENVPGLLSSNSGRDFAEVLRVLMVECGYGICWRVLDSQFFGVAQRRERLFIVGRFGKPCPPAVLFECSSSDRNPAEGGTIGKDIAGTLAPGAHSSGFNGQDAYCGHLIPIAFGANDDGRDASEGIVPTLRCGGIGGGGVHTAVAFAQNQRGELRTMHISSQLTCGGGKPGEGYAATLCAPPDSNGVRDLASLPKGMDSPRYRALGNAVTSSVAQWIATRIKEVIEFPTQPCTDEVASGVNESASTTETV